MKIVLTKTGIAAFSSNIGDALAFSELINKRVQDQFVTYFEIDVLVFSELITKSCA